MMMKFYHYHLINTILLFCFFWAAHKLTNDKQPIKFSGKLLLLDPFTDLRMVFNG